MKTLTKRTSNEIELSLWQLLALIVAGCACVFAVAPVVAQYQSVKCDVIYINEVTKPTSTSSELTSDLRGRYVRDVASQDQCAEIPPMCSATTTVSTMSTSPTVSTTRSTPSTVKVTRPVITAYPTTPRTTTPDPWANSSRPYQSWRLPTFATPIAYTLSITCPACFELISNTSSLTFTGHVSIRISISTATDHIVLHAKNLNILQASLSAGGTGSATTTYLPEFEMVYLQFPSPIAPGDITLEIDYTGMINERDQTGFYREVFWKSIGEISYLLATNFQPIHARQAFPCFDEPSMQATFTLTLDHPAASTIALSNLGVASTAADSSTFVTTPPISTSSFAWAILPTNEFPMVTKKLFDTEVNIYVRPELAGPSNTNLDWTFDLVEKALQFIQDYTNTLSTSLPAKLDLIGIPDLIVDEKASASWGLLTFREELLSTDGSLNSAERMQTTAKIIVEHILQPWFSTTDWWDNIWLGKSLSSFLAYKVIEQAYPAFGLMEQFPIREMMPLMMNDFKPSIWPVSEKNLTSNEEVLDYLSTHIYSKGAALLRQLEYIAGEDTFQAAVSSVFSVSSVSDVLSTFYSSFNDTLANSTVTAEEFMRSWLEESNYPLVTIDFIPNNDTQKNTTLIFRQTRYFGSFVLDNSPLNLNYTWKIYMECDLGGFADADNFNLSANYAPSRLKFILESSTQVIQLLDEEYTWIKCNKGFYSFQVTEYISYGEDANALWQDFELLFNDDTIFSSNDRANLLNDAFILPHGGEVVSYDQTINLVRELFRNPVANYIPWSVFVWHWNYLMGVEEHSKYFWNFKSFATRQVLAPFSSNIDNIVTDTNASHQERLLKSMLFELLCRVQNPDALNKATELFRRIPASYFLNSTGATNVQPDYLSTAIYYHIQNTNDADEWNYLWANFTENESITGQQRNVFLRALGASKETWRLKSILEQASDADANLIETQELFDLIVAISQNPNGRDVVWNFYRHNYRSFLVRYGEDNRLFNQLITSIVHSFENEYYYFQMTKFVDENPSASRNQQLAKDQILMNFEWLLDGMAEGLDNAISAGDRINSEK